MCQSKAKGGRRCYGHTHAAYDRAKGKVAETFAARQAASQAIRAHADQFGPAGLHGNPQALAEHEALTQSWRNTRAPYEKAEQRLEKARVALAGTERGFLEVMAEADAIEDSARGLRGNARTAVSRKAEWVRSQARAGRDDRTVHEQHAHEQAERVRTARQAWASGESRPQEFVVVKNMGTFRLDGGQMVPYGEEDHRRDEEERRRRADRNARAATRAAQADRRARTARLTELSGEAA